MLTIYKEEIHNNIEQNLNYIKCLTPKERAFLITLLQYERYIKPTYKKFNNKDYFYFNRNEAKKIFEKAYNKPIHIDFISYTLTKLYNLGIIDKINNKVTLGNKLITTILINIDYANLMKYLCFNYCRNISQEEIYEICDLYLNNKELFYQKYFDGKLEEESFIDALKKIYELKNFNIVVDKDLSNKILAYIENIYKNFLSKNLLKNQSYNVRNKVPYFYIQYQDVLKYINKPLSITDIENVLLSLLYSKKLVRSFDNKYALMSTYNPVKEDLDCDYDTDKDFCISKSKWEELDKYFNTDDKDKDIDSLEGDIVEDKSDKEEVKPKKPKKSSKKNKDSKGKDAVDDYIETNEKDIESDALYDKMIEFANYLSVKKQLSPQTLYQNFELLFHSNTSLAQKISIIDKTMLRNYNTLLYEMEKLKVNTDWKSPEVEKVMQKQLENKEKSHLPKGWTQEQFDEYWEQMKDKHF